MSEPLITAILITLVGMGLVLGAILLLWGVIALLMAFTAERTRPEPAAEAHPSADQTEMELKKQAAVAAVAVALAKDSAVGEPHEFPLPPTVLVSPWQAVMRTKMLNKRGSVR